MLCEKELLLKVADGDKAAFGELFNAYYQHLGAHIYRITNSVEHTEEIVQDAFLKIWLNRDGLSLVHNFKAYLFVVSKNQALNFLKKVAREKVQQRLAEKSLAVAAIQDDEDSKYYYSLIDEAIDQLPPQQQKVYLMSRHEKLKYQEIAHQLDISRETVKKYLQLATASIYSYVQDKSSANSLPLIFFYFFFKNL